MPLHHFFAYITFAFFSLLLLVMIIAPLSFWKVSAIVGLYTLSIITALLMWINYQLTTQNQQTIQEFETVMPNDTESSNDSVHKDFMA
jgi:cytochrome c biogenesis factor